MSRFENPPYASSEQSSTTRRRAEQVLKKRFVEATPVAEADATRLMEQTEGIEQAFRGETRAVLDGLRRRSGVVTAEELQATFAAEAHEHGQRVEDAGERAENPFEGTSIDPDSVQKHVLEAYAGVMAGLDEALEAAGRALAEGNMDDAGTLAKQFAQRLEASAKQHLPPEVVAMYEDVYQHLDAIIQEQDPQAKSRLYEFACAAMDFIPLAGPAKMIGEAAAGKTLGGETLEGWKRVLHGLEGTVFLAIDLTGFGVVATKLAKAGKSATMGPRLITRSAAFLRAIGVSREIYKPVYTAGSFLLRHPRLGQLATRGLEDVIKMRQARLALVPNKLRATTKEVEYRRVTQRPGMNLAEVV